MIQYHSPILTDNSDPTSAFVWTQCAGGQVDLLTANSNSESSSSLTGGDHIEKAANLVHAWYEKVDPLACSEMNKNEKMLHYGKWL